MAAERPVRGSERPDAPLYLLAAAGLVVGIPACLAGLALEPLARRHRRESGLAALAGLALCALLWPAIRGQATAAVDALIPEGGLLAGGIDWAAAWPHLWRWWALTLPLAPAFAFLIVALRPKTVGEQREREHRRRERTRERDERRARRRLGAVEPTQDGPAAVLGRKVWARRCCRCAGATSSCRSHDSSATCSCSAPRAPARPRRSCASPGRSPGPPTGRCCS